MAQPKPIADVLSQLMARRGYARLQAESRLAAAWIEAVGEVVGRQTRPGNVRRGTLEVHCASSLVVHELSFQKRELVARLAQLAPDESIRDLRLKVGPVD